MHWLSTLGIGLRRLCSFRVQRHNCRRRAPQAKRTPRSGRELQKWLWDGLMAMALTKSEARAQFKRERGLKRRLPIGAVVVRAA